MRLSTRKQLPWKIISIQHGDVMAVVKVALDGGGQVITSTITREAVEDLGLAEDAAVTVLVKSTEVSLAVECARSGVRGRALRDCPPRHTRVSCVMRPPLTPMSRRGSLRDAQRRGVSLRRRGRQLRSHRRVAV
jgi:molybdopterin-binding protein